MRKILMMLSAAICFISSQSLAADPNDFKVIQDCLNVSAKNSGTECIGKVFDFCAPTPDKMSMQAQIACFAREYQAWDAVLNETYQRLSAQIDDSAKPKLAAVRSSWNTARQQTCDFFGGAHAGDLSGMRRNICYQTETANRVYLIQSMLGLF